MKKLFFLLTLSIFCALTTNPVRASMETVKIYPTDDGHVQLYDEDLQSEWLAARNYNGLLTRSPRTENATIGVRSDNQALGYYRIYRASFVFDTSLIPDDAEILKADLNLFGLSCCSAGEIETVLTSHSRSSTTQLMQEDWYISNYKTEFGRKTLANEKYDSISINTAGMDYIDKSGFSIFGLITNLDFDNVVPVDGRIFSQTIYSTEAPGTSTDPYLEVTYTVQDELTLSELMALLIEKVESGDFDKHMKNAYLAHLKNVEEFYDNGQTGAAENQIQQFISKVLNDLSKENIELESGEELLDLSGKVLEIFEYPNEDGNVPLITQVESPHPSVEETTKWADDVYASGSAAGSCGTTIAQCGCALASMSMLAKSYGVSEGIDGSDINPGNMNSWLTSNSGYTPDGNALWGKILEYLGRKVGNKTITNFSLASHNVTDTNVIDDFLGTSGPVLAFNNALGHFFLLTEKNIDDSYSVRDPYWYETESTNQIKDTANNVQGYNDVISKANLFTFSETSKKLAGLIEIHLGSPAEVLLTDKEGRRTGYDPDTKQLVNEIPGASYDQLESVFTDGLVANPHAEKVLMVLSPEGDEYELEVIGTGEGDYDLTVYTSNGDGDSSVHIESGETTKDEVDEYYIKVGDGNFGHGNDDDGCDEDNQGEGGSCGVVG